jgi:hypothetical protein
MVLSLFFEAVCQCRRRLPPVSGWFTRTVFTAYIANGHGLLTIISAMDFKDGVDFT